MTIVSPVSSSLLDEVQAPAPPKVWICPCCVFTFNDKALLLAHCEEMKRRIDAFIEKVSK